MQGHRPRGQLADEARGGWFRRAAHQRHGRELSGDVAACPSRSRRPDGGWPRPARSGTVPAAPGTWESCPNPSPDTGSIADATSGAHRDPGDMPTWAKW